MKYLLRAEAADRVRGVIACLMHHQDQLDESDRARVDQLLDMSEAWCNEQPTVQALFEVLDNTYEFFEPRTWGHDSVDSYVTHNVSASFIRSSIAASRRNVSQRPRIHTHCTFQDDVLILSADEYDYSLVVNAHPSSEPGLYEISVNVND